MIRLYDDDPGDGRMNVGEFTKLVTDLLTIRDDGVAPEDLAVSVVVAALADVVRLLLPSFYVLLYYLSNFDTIYTFIRIRFKGFDA